MNDSSNAGPLARPATLGAASLLLAVGLIHLLLTPEHLEEATYLGLLFAADFVGSVVAAVGVLLGRRWGWMLGAVISAGAFQAYFIDGTMGLPGMEPGGLLEPLGIAAKTLEALFLVLCAYELFSGFGRRALALGVATVLVAAGFGAVFAALGASSAGESQHGPGSSAEQHGGE